MENVEAFQFSLSFHSAKASYFEEFICKMEKIHKSTFDGKISWRLNLIFSKCVVGLVILFRQNEIILKDSTAFVYVTKSI